MSRVKIARELLKKNKLYSYQVADHLGVEPSNFSSWFRSEVGMTDKRLERIKNAVEELVNEAEHDAEEDE